MIVKQPATLEITDIKIAVKVLLVRKEDPLCAAKICLRYIIFLQIHTDMYMYLVCPN